MCEIINYCDVQTSCNIVKINADDKILIENLKNRDDWDLNFST